MEHFLILQDLDFHLIQMNVATVQLHLNSWIFVLAFEILMEFLGVEPAINIFFMFFHLKGVWKGLWISLNGHLKKKKSSICTKAHTKISRIGFF